MTQDVTQTKPEMGLDPDEIEALYDIAKEETLDEVADLYEDEGFDPDEIDELLYGDDETDVYRPRRHRRARRSSRHAPRSYDPARRRRRRGGRRKSRRMYDPPREGVGRKFRRKAPGALKAVMKYAGLITGGGKFLLDYNARAKALGTNPKTNKEYTLVEAIQYDVQNFNASDATKRLQEQVGTYGAEVIGGMILKSNPVKRVVGRKYSMYVDGIGNALIGIGVETAAKALLDPPVPGCCPRPPITHVQAQDLSMKVVNYTPSEQPSATQAKVAAKYIPYGV